MQWWDYIETGEKRAAFKEFTKVIVRLRGIQKQIRVRTRKNQGI